MADISEALHCVNHALMVLPLPSDGPGKRAWSSLLEAQKILDALSAAVQMNELSRLMEERDSALALAELRQRMLIEANAELEAYRADFLLGGDNG